MAAPHVREWWNHDPTPDAVERDFGGAIDGAEPGEDWIAELDGRPIGDGAASIDYLVGDLDPVGRSQVDEMTADWIRPIVHFEILTRDPSAQRRFYGELFNWPFGDGPIMNVPSGLGGPEPGPAGHMRQSHQRSELTAQVGLVEDVLRRECRLRVGPDREGEPPTVVVAAECSTDESGLLICELDLDPFVERPEGVRVDAGREAKCQDLEHGVDATVR